MKNRLLFIWLILFSFSLTLQSQPTIAPGPETQTVLSGEAAAIPFKTLDFTDILLVEFIVEWDPEVVHLDSEEPFADFNPLLNLTGAEFLVDSAGGSFIFVWVLGELTDPCGPNSSVTIPDEEVLFTANFVGITGSTEVLIFDSPTGPYITRFSACPVNIGCFCDQTATINVEGEPSSTFAGGALASAPITLFPNPSSHSFQLQWPDQLPEAERLQILDVHGKVFWDGTFRPNRSWPTEFLPAGLYFIRLLWKDGQSWTKTLAVE